MRSGLCVRAAVQPYLGTSKAASQRWRSAALLYVTEASSLSCGFVVSSRCSTFAWTSARIFAETAALPSGTRIGASPSKTASNESSPSASTSRARVSTCSANFHVR